MVYPPRRPDSGSRRPQNGPQEHSGISRFGGSARRGAAFIPKTLKNWKPLAYQECALECRSGSYFFLPADSGFHNSRHWWLCQAASAGHLICKVTNPRTKWAATGEGGRKLFVLASRGLRRLGGFGDCRSLVVP